MEVYFSHFKKINEFGPDVLGFITEMFLAQHGGLLILQK
jgi:hypothetical protein